MTSEERVIQPRLGLLGDMSARKTSLSEGAEDKAEQVAPPEEINNGPIGPRILKKVNRLWESLAIAFPSLALDEYKAEIGDFFVAVKRDHIAYQGQDIWGFRASVWSNDLVSFSEFTFTARKELIGFLICINDPKQEGDQLVSETEGEFENEELVTFGRYRVLRTRMLDEERVERDVDTFALNIKEKKCVKLAGSMVSDDNNGWNWKKKEPVKMDKEKARDEIEAWLKSFKGIQSLKQDGQKTSRAASE